MADFIIRQARHPDVPAMAALLRQLFAIEKDFQFDAARAERGLRALLEKRATSGPGAEQAQCLVAEAGRKVIAMCSVQVLISTAMGSEVGLLEDMIVDASRRHAGVGKALLTEADAWCRQRGLPRLQLLADRDNRSALAFYEKQGWETTNLHALRRFMSEN